MSCFKEVHVRCHESWPWTSVYSPPEVTHSPHGLLHYTNCCTSPKTTFPIIHCTDDTQLISLITHHTRFISLGLPLCDRRVLYAHIASLADSYLTEPFVVFIVLFCLFRIVFSPAWIIAVYLDYLSLCLALLDIVRRSKTHACPRSTLCPAIYIPVCQCLTHACFWPQPLNKSLQMDLNASSVPSVTSGVRGDEGARRQGYPKYTGFNQHRG